MDAGNLALKRLALALADIPRWVETRSMLLACGSEVLGMSELPRVWFVTRDT